MIHTEKTFKEIVETIENAIISGDLAFAETLLANPEVSAAFEKENKHWEVYAARIAWSKGDFETAGRKIASLLKNSSIKTGSDLWTELLMMRAFINQGLGHTNKAEKDLEKLLKTLHEDSDHYSEVQYNFATSNRDQGKLELAETLYQSVIDSKKSTPEMVTRSALAIAKMRSDLDRPGVKLYTAIVAEVAPRWGGWSVLKTAEILDDLSGFREGQCGKSLRELFRHVRETDESNFTIPRIRARLALSEALIELGDYAAAKGFIEETGLILTSLQHSGVKHLQNHVELLWYQADIRQNGQRDSLWEALDRLEILLAVVAKYPRPPGPAPFWLLIGEVQIKLGQFEQGLRSIQRARSEAESIGAISVAAAAGFQLATLEWNLLKENQRHQGMERNRILAETTHALESTSTSPRPELEWRIHYLRGKIFSESGEQYPAREELKTAAGIVHRIVTSLENPSLQSIYRKSPLRHEALLVLQTVSDPLQLTMTTPAQPSEPQPSGRREDVDRSDSARKLQDVMKAMLELHSAGTFQELFEILLIYTLQIINADRAQTIIFTAENSEGSVIIKARSGSNDESAYQVPERWLHESESTQGVLTYLWEADQRNSETRHLILQTIREQDSKKAILCVDRIRAKGIFNHDEIAILKTLTSVVSVACSSLAIRKRLSEISEQLRREIIPEFPHIIGQSDVMKRVFMQMQRVAPSDIPVLIQGETGTGKDLIARTIHDISNRAEAPFVHLDCSSIPMTLLESELFGIEDGIATGVESRVGLIEYANGGTILMDEVGDIPLNTQAKLLRVLQEHEFEPVGSDRILSVDIRIIATSTRDLDELIREGKLREDFYYRISGLVINLPPIRDRSSDIVALARTFLQKYNLEFRKNISGFTPDLLDAMMGYFWPGNVRELDHLVRRAVLFCQEDRLTIADMDLPITKELRLSLTEAICNMEHAAAKEVFQITDGDRTRTAEILKISVKRLDKLLKGHDISSSGVPSQ